jgi:hypothetical protein
MYLIWLFGIFAPLIDTAVRLGGKPDGPLYQRPAI